MLNKADPNIPILLFDPYSAPAPAIKVFSPSLRNLDAECGFEIVDIPYQAPNANAYAERWVRSVREECLGRLLVWNEAHLRRVLAAYVQYYNSRRPHQGLGQDSPDGLKVISAEGEIHRRDVLGGIIHDYYRQEA
jgi:hypothetical protein